MFRSLYAYKGTHSRTLSFSPSEKFLEVGTSTDPNWIHVISEKGHVGYVPKNYVTFEQVAPHEMLEIIDCCIEGIHSSTSLKGGSYSHYEYEALQELVEIRQDWHSRVPPSSHPSKRPAPPPPNILASHSTTNNKDNKGNYLSSVGNPQPIAIAAAVATDREDSGIEVASLTEGGSSLDGDYLNHQEDNGLEQNDKMLEVTLQTSSEICQSIPKGYYRQLVEDIRMKTNVSYITSNQVVSLIMKSMAVTFPPLEPLMQGILNSKGVQKSVENSSLLNWEESGDGRKLVELLEKLRQCKDDDQQRSWALHEDEDFLKELLSNLLDILTNGDVEVCKAVLALDDNRPLLTVVQYYQMEARWLLRKILLQIFAAMCQMSRSHISYLSSSILPLELTRVVMLSKSSPEELQYSVLVLGMVLSMGDTLPYTHFSIMNESFVEEVLSGIERYSEDADTETLAELYMTLILSFNLQDCLTSTKPKYLASESIVTSVLSKRKEAKHFIEKLLLLFNREENPVAMFDHEPQPPHSVLCMMSGLLGSQNTAQLLYTNDEKVVCDIILRQLTDLPAEDKHRCEYLCLLEGVVRYGNWPDHKHRRSELESRLSAISHQKDSSSDAELAYRIYRLIVNV